MNYIIIILLLILIIKSNNIRENFSNNKISLYFESFFNKNLKNNFEFECFRVYDSKKASQKY